MIDLSRPALLVAPELVGCLLRTGGVVLRIDEVEAYEGRADPASHAWAGLTARNAVMFGPAGHLYVYRLHGHHCCNVVCREEGTASAVLLRAGTVIEGLDAARARRPGVTDSALARGPGNLCRAAGITMALHGAALTGPEIELLTGPAPARLASGPRTNVSRAWSVPWRFWDADSPAVSPYKAHPASRG